MNETDIKIDDQGMQNEQLCQDVGDSSTLLSDIRRISINSRPSSDEQALKFVENTRLNETETSCLIIPHLARVDSELLYSEDSELLRVQPEELCFPFVSPLPQKKAMMSCSLQLNNKENDRVAFMLVANNPRRYLTKKPLCGVVPPRCVYTLSLTMPKQPLPASPSSSDSGGDFFTLYSVAVGEYKLRDLDKDSVSVRYRKFFEKARENTVAGEEVHEVTLKASICDRPADQGTSSSSEIITMPDAQQVSSIDVHPTEPWIMTTNYVGILRVRNYHTMTALNSFELVAYEPVRAAKFVLSLSDEDEKPLIKLWNWDKGWECTREFQGHDNKVTQVTFNPKDKDSFASASFDGTIKIWSICSDDIITLKLDHGESLLCVDYSHAVIGNI